MDSIRADVGLRSFKNEYKKMAKNKTIRFLKIVKIRK